MERADSSNVVDEIKVAFADFSPDHTVSPLATSNQAALDDHYTSKDRSNGKSDEGKLPTDGHGPDETDAEHGDDDESLTEADGKKRFGS